MLSGSAGASLGCGASGTAAAAPPSSSTPPPARAPSSSSLSDIATAWVPTPLGGSGGSAGTAPSEALPKKPWRPPAGLPSALTGVPVSGVPGLPSDSAALLGSPAGHQAGLR